MKRVGGFLNESMVAYYIFCQSIKKSKDLLLVVEDDFEIDKFYETFNSILNLFEKDGFEIIKFSLNRDEIKKGIELLYNSKKRKILISSIKSLEIKFPSVNNLGYLMLKVGDEIKRGDLVAKLISCGFSKTSFVEKTGEFATRGSVVDIYEWGEDYPVRLFFDGDKLEAIKKFDIETQNTFDFQMSLSISNMNLKEISLKDMDFERYSYRIDIDGFNYLDSVYFDENIDYFENIKFVDLNVFKNEITKFLNDDFGINIFVLNEKESLKIIKTFEEFSIPLKGIKFHYGYLNKGFYSKSHKIAVISSNEVFNRDYNYYNLKKDAKKFFRLNELNYGDFVVHEEYGIGIFRGIKDFEHRDEWGNVYLSECVEIEYAGGDKLYIWLNDFKKIQKYIGSDGSKVKLSSLSSTSWNKLKEKIKKEIEFVAKDIIRLEAKRKVLKIKPMFKTEFEDDFELSFPYSETEDQKNAIRDVLRDLEDGVISNRIIVGDVGFGKTEVAMRAIFRAVTNGFQVAVLVPTTILAQQHYQNFKKRFEKFNINVEVLSRITPLKKQKEIIRDISRGVIDVIIGTHKLLGKDIRFKNLGLIVVDEEHKFGVKQKEEIKKKEELAHVIYLSATPIPRTLYQSLSNLRDMSVIESPPLGRLPIETKVVAYDENLVVNAVDREIKRNGQIYYVYNRVEFIDKKAEQLSKLLPGIKIAVIHGQMKGDVIEDIMIDFYEKKYDLLLASTIIESGIDIPSVNTLIVEDAHKLGLAQLYQLRGRIGREKQKAYCYLFYPKWFEKEENQTINSDMMKRLFALQEFSELGSGFRLAMRDLEIRGAGELLGTRQHGYINSIGLDMYINLLNSEIKKIRGEKVEEEDDIMVDLKISAFIPQNYIGDDLERLNFYKRLYNAQSLQEINEIVDKMKDIAGPLPQEVINLVNIVKIKRILKGKGIKKIIEKNDRVEFYFSKNFKPDSDDILRWQKVFKNNLRFFKTSEGDGLEIRISEKNRIDIIMEVFNIKL